jgi:hypothetical protein
MSIATKKLQYSKSWEDYLNTILFVITALLGFILCPIFVISFELNFAHQNDKFLAYFILPLLICFGIYSVYRTWTELNLKKLTTSLSQEKNQDIVLEFARKNEYEIRRNYNHCIVIDIPKMNSNYAMTAIIFVMENYIYYTMIQDNFKINTPTFFSHLLFAWRLKKWFRKNDDNNCVVQVSESK